MTGTEMIKSALTAFEITGHSALLSQGVEIGVATCDQFVWVSLVAYIPDNPVAIQIKGLIQRKREFNNPETWTEVAAAVGHHFQVTLANLSGNILQFRHRQTMQLIGMR